PRFLGLRVLRTGAGEALSEIALPPDADREERGYGVHPGLLDAALQSWEGTRTSDGRPGAIWDHVAWLPFEIGRLVVYEPGKSDAFVHIRLADGMAADAPVVDLTVMDAAGTVIAEVSRLRYRRGDALMAAGAALDAVFELAWQPATSTAPPMPLA